MKKFMKICGITVAILLAVGLILAVIGKIGGGSSRLLGQILDGRFNWKIDWDAFSMGDKLESVFGDLDTFDIDEKNLFDKAFAVIRNEDSWQQSFSADDIHDLDLELGGLMLTIEESPDSEFHVEAGKIGSLQAYVQNGTLYVRGVKTGNWSDKLVMEVTLKIPAGVIFTEVEFSLGAGDFHVDTALIAKEATFEIGAGRLQIKDLQAGELECELGAGQVLIDNAELVNASLEVGVGELRFAGSIAGDLDAECAMGSIKMEIFGSTWQDHNYKLECGAGSLTAGERHLSGLAGSDFIDNHAASTYDLSCVMGELTLTFQ